MKLSKRVVGLTVLACGMMRMQGQSSAATVPGIEVSTVKPSDPNTPGALITVRGRHFVTINTNVSDLIRFAYGLHPKQVEGAPTWRSQWRLASGKQSH